MRKIRKFVIKYLMNTPTGKRHYALWSNASMNLYDVLL